MGKYYQSESLHLEATTSVVQALKEITNKQLSGQLIIRSFNDPSNGWRVYVGRGKVHYATSLVANQQRMDYLLSQWFPNLKVASSIDSNNEYNFLSSCWHSGQISFHQLRDLMYRLTQEALIHCLAFPPAQLEFQSHMGLDPIIVSASVKEIASPIRPQVLEWKKLAQGIASPLQQVGIEHPNQFYNAIASTISKEGSSKLSKDLTSLIKPLTQFPNLYQLAKQVNLDPLSLAQQLQPYLNQKQLQVQPYQSSDTPQGEAPVIACIDDSHAVQRNVKLILERAGYQVVSITDPTHALTNLARCKPILILMDITMPEMNGYDLSRILRKSQSLADVPIVMLTGRDGVVDRVRARMVGANSYITKPFNPNQLIQLVQQLTRQPEVVFK